MYRRPGNGSGRDPAPPSIVRVTGLSRIRYRSASACPSRPSARGGSFEPQPEQGHPHREHGEGTTRRCAAPPNGSRSPPCTWRRAISGRTKSGEKQEKRSGISRRPRNSQSERVVPQVAAWTRQMQEGRTRLRRRHREYRYWRTRRAGRYTTEIKATRLSSSAARGIQRGAPSRESARPRRGPPPRRQGGVILGLHRGARRTEDADFRSDGGGPRGRPGRTCAGFFFVIRQ